MDLMKLVHATRSLLYCFSELNTIVGIYKINPGNPQKIYHLLTESEVITGKSQTEALMYWPSDSEVNTSRLRSEISL